MKEKILNYLSEASLTTKGIIVEDTLIFESGLLDSMGLLFLIEFLNENYQIEVNDDELDPKNFESVNSIVSFVERKLKAKESV